MKLHSLCFGAKLNPLKCVKKNIQPDHTEFTAEKYLDFIEMWCTKSTGDENIKAKGSGH